MKKLTWFFFLCLPLFSVAQEATGVQFSMGLSWKQVIEKAKAENKYIFVDFYTTWCGPCKLMEQNTFPSDTVGKVLNSAFVAIRVQCDSTKKDSKAVQKWYADAHELVTRYNVNSYPSFLFFSPEGDIIHKDGGYVKPAEFIALVEQAIDPKRNYLALLKTYREGKLYYDQMPPLLRRAEDLNDTKTWMGIANDYVHNYLNKLNFAVVKKSDLKNTTQVTFSVFRYEDNYFRWLLANPKLADSLLNANGYADIIVGYVANRDDVDPAMVKAQRKNTAPDWEAINKILTRKYGEKYAKKLGQKGKLDWFDRIKDGKSYCQIYIDTVEANGYANDPDKYFDFLNEVAFEVFQRSSDTGQLTKVLGWMGPVVAKLTDNTPHASDLLDTQAELLYKLGRKEEAIAIEGRAVNIDVNKKYRSFLNKMRAGEPTW